MSCHYVIDQRIPGDFVECGVWRGGNAILAADVFRRRSPERNVYLFDTFAGMTEPRMDDIDFNGVDAIHRYRDSMKGNDSGWCYASLEEVRNNFLAASLLTDRVRFIAGDVAVSLNTSSNLPNAISVLRLDTDWYESTFKELNILYPRVSDRGVLIVDDYGHWAGARRAVDEYFHTRKRPFLY